MPFVLGINANYLPCLAQRVSHFYDFTIGLPRLALRSFNEVGLRLVMTSWGNNFGSKVAGINANYLPCLAQWVSHSYDFAIGLPRLTLRSFNEVGLRLVMTSWNDNFDSKSVGIQP